MLKTVFASAVVLWIVGWRLYVLFLRVRESQRGDQAEDSGITTLFHSDQNEGGAETSDIQTLFSDNDSSSP